MSTVVVVAGGEAIDPSHLHDLPRSAFVIAADSGLDRAQEVGLVPDLVVGDLDSAGSEALSDHHGAVERHPTDKDATDLELALRAAGRRRPDHIVVLGGGGGRFDHLLGNVLVLTTVEGATVEWRPVGATIHIVRERCELEMRVGSVVSLIPVQGSVHVLSTSGLRWPLHDETLDFGTTRGVSNESTRSSVTVEVANGLLALVVPRQP